MDAKNEIIEITKELIMLTVQKMREIGVEKPQENTTIEIMAAWLAHKKIMEAYGTIGDIFDDPDVKKLLAIADKAIPVGSISMKMS